MDLESLRRKIDGIDEEIVRLLDERVDVALEIGKLKGASGMPHYAPGRELEVYERVASLGKGQMPPEALKAIYREVMSATLSLQKRTTVAYWGPAGTFTHQAAMTKFGSSCDYLPEATIAEVFTVVRKGKADFGVVPIENSTEGVVNYTLDMLIDSELLVCSEIMLPISHNLIGKGQLADVKKVYSNPTAMAQCRRWLESNIPSAELIDVSTTSRGAELAAKEGRLAAAIAGRLAAELNGLDVIAERIEDATDNFTRFLVVGKSDSAATGRDKTSVVFATRHKAGALYDALYFFKKYGVNLTMIESRPSGRRAWEYFFFVDFEGHREDSKVKDALRDLSEEALFVRVLGSYPQAEGANGA